MLLSYCSFFISVLFFAVHFPLCSQQRSDVKLDDILNQREPIEWKDKDGSNSNQQNSGVATSNEDQIKSTINQLFDGMREGNAGLITPLFVPGAQLKSVYADQYGNTQISAPTSMENFAEAIGRPRQEQWDEQIWSYDISIDEPLAYAWTEYSFFVDEQLSHCGVNMFEMARLDGKWKIINITDTRRKTDCQLNPKNDINTFMDKWHQAAATANEDVFFGSMGEDAIYIGTDISERWTKTSMMKDLMQYFTQSNSAWSFTAKERNISLSENGEIAWLDEALDTWMGDCRSTAVLIKTSTGWKIQHYQLSMAVPNNKVNEYLQIIGKPRRG